MEQKTIKNARNCVGRSLPYHSERKKEADCLAGEGTTLPDVAPYKCLHDKETDIGVYV